MKASQKGTRLNDVRCFRQPRPYTRTRITKTRLLPDFPLLGSNENAIATSNDHRYQRSASHRSSDKPGARCITLDRDQRSREIALWTYSSESLNTKTPDVPKDCSKNRDICVETDPKIEILSGVAKNLSPDMIDHSGNSIQGPALKSNCLKPKEIGDENKERIGGTKDDLENEKCKIQTTRHEPREKLSEKKDNQNLTTSKFREMAVKVKKGEIQALSENPKNETSPETREIYNELETPAMRKDKISRRTKRRGNYIRPPNEHTSFQGGKSFWSRYQGLQKIINFFGHLLARRGSANRGKEAEVPRRVGTSSRGEETLERSMDSPIKSARTRESTKNNKKKRIDLSKQENDHRIWSGPKKRIVEGEEQLRTTLLHHEIKNRKLEEENRRYKKILGDKLKTRQMSSPLH